MNVINEIKEFLGHTDYECLVFVDTEGNWWRKGSPSFYKPLEDGSFEDMPWNLIGSTDDVLDEINRIGEMFNSYTELIEMDKDKIKIQIMGYS